ncbi:hypothetical protein ACR79T_10040 [Sphingobacterium spiritivorum]|uniref:hypothetical protein n=1 Tax=Sphingobacterium spiritivorum TaxID=258 RepID=UPI003DA4E486
MRSTIIILIFLLSTFTVYSQENSEMFYKVLLKELKNLPVESSAVRTLIVDKLNKEVKEMPEEFRKPYIEYKNELLNMMFIDTKAKSLDVLTKEDVKGLDYSYDKFNKMNFIKLKHHEYNLLSPYISIDSQNRMFLNLRANYSGSSWIFFDKMIVLIGTETFTYIFKSEPDRDVGSGVKEVITDTVDEELYKILEQISNANSPTSIRLQGDKYIDYKLSKKNIEGIKNLLNVFNKLKE